MSNSNIYSALIAPSNSELENLELSWKTAVYSSEDGIGCLGSLHEAGDALVAVARMEEKGSTIIGSGVMVAPGLLLTATHVLEEFSQHSDSPVFFTFLPGAMRAWLPQDVMTVSQESKFHADQKITSDLSLVSCSLNSDAHAIHPLMLAPMKVTLPLIGERLWAFGFRHQKVQGSTALLTPMVSSGLVTAAFPNGRGERMPSPCFEVAMDTIGGMSGGAVVNADGYLVGIISSSMAGGPSYITLIWDAIRYSVKGTVPKLAVRDKVSLLRAKALGLARIKGNFSCDPWGNVKIRLNEGEGELFSQSYCASAEDDIKQDSLNGEELEIFIEDWGAALEDIAAEEVIRALSQLSLSGVRRFLKASDIPSTCLDAIQEFSVTDWEGVEDLEITGTETIENNIIKINFFLELSNFIWTIKVQEKTYRDNLDDFQKNFYNIEIEDGIASMEIFQRGYFRASATLDKQQERLTDVTVIDSAIKRR